MMLSVFICEDDPKQRELLETTVNEYVGLEEYEIELALSTDNPIEFIEYLTAHPKQNNLYILDVNLRHEKDGIALAKQIRELDFHGKMVFVTTHAELSYLIFRYRIEALDYIIKINAEDIVKKVRECIEVTHHRCRETVSEQKTLQVKTSVGVQKIPIDDILFVETYHVPHKLILHTKNERIEFRGNLKDITKISPDFFRCHKAYVVNVKNIKRIQRISKVAGETEMINGATIPVSATKIRALGKTVMK